MIESPDASVSCARRRRVWVASLALLALAACTTAPREPSPDLLTGLVPDNVRLQWRRAAATVPGSEAAADRWWQSFGDPVLDTLQDRLLAGNLDLSQLTTRVASARATLGGSEAARYPSTSVSFGKTRSDNVTVPHRLADSVSLGLATTWEVDLWGRLANNRQAARANLEAAQADFAAARLSVQYSLTQLYIELRAVEAQQMTVARNVRGSEQTFFLTRSRFESGLVSRADLLQAESQMHGVQSQAIELGLQRNKLANAIAVLLGRPPGSVQLAETGRLPAIPELPPELPSTALERRPDIAAAERRVAASYAQIGAADAAFFPVLSISANAGYRSDTMASLLDLPSRLWSFGPSLAMALLDGGTREVGRKQARASADAAVAAYRQVVLSGLQEISDNLESAARLREELDLQIMARSGATRTLDITLDQYRAGSVGFLSVLVAQTAVLSTESSVTDVQRRQLLASAQLLKNAGGRW